MHKFCIGCYNSPKYYCEGDFDECPQLGVDSDPFDYPKYKKRGRYARISPATLVSNGESEQQQNTEADAEDDTLHNKEEENVSVSAPQNLFVATNNVTSDTYKICEDTTSTLAAAEHGESEQQQVTGADDKDDTLHNDEEEENISVSAPKNIVAANNNVTAETFKIREDATSAFDEESLTYPDNWDFSHGIPGETWQLILLYLEERYGDQKNKTIKAPVYPEDIHNLRLLVSLFPDRAPAAKFWLEKLSSQKVSKPRASKGKAEACTGNSGNIAANTSIQDASFTSSSNSQRSTISTMVSLEDTSVDLNACKKAIDFYSASQLFNFFRERNNDNICKDMLDLLVVRLKKEMDSDEAHILFKIVRKFGRSTAI